VGNIKYIYDNFNKVILFLLLLFLIFIIPQIVLKTGPLVGVVVSLFPVAFLFILLLIDKPYFSFIFLFSLNYFISGISRYITSIPPGITMDLVISLVIIIIIFQFFKKKNDLSASHLFNALTLLTFIWFLYSVLQIFNPNSLSPIAWLTNVRGLGVYFLLITAIASTFLRDYKRVKNLLIIWAIFSLLAVSKALMQRYIGFDFAESRWLALGGANTHILQSGIRYFSFFTDAASFGSGMGFSFVVFVVSSFHFKKLRLKIFFFLVAIICLYGMFMSGTRASIVIPFAGLSVFALLSKNLKAIVLTITVILFSFGFLKYTYIGQSNQYIRRMRSVFNSDDASFVVRVENQKLIRTYVKGKPFGIGIGMMRGGAKTYRPHPILSKIAHDSWYVLIWVEMGIVGLVLNLFIFLYIIVHGSYLVLFKLKNRELSGIVKGIIGGLTGLYIAAYTLEIFGQFPNAFIIFICMTIIFLSPVLDQQLEETEIDTNGA